MTEAGAPPTLRPPVLMPTHEPPGERLARIRFQI